MVSVIIDGLHHVTDDTPQLDLQRYASSTRAFIIHQNTHGWRGIFRGLIPILLYNSLTLKPSLRRSNWVARLITNIFNYHYTIWTHRNEAVHATSSITDQVLVHLQQSVLSWYDRQSELTASSRALLSDDSSTILSLRKQSSAELNHQLTSFHAHYL